MAWSAFSADDVVSEKTGDILPFFGRGFKAKPPKTLAEFGPLR
jgi:hypothetical protein